MKKLLAGGALAVLAFSGLVAGAAPASAHTPNVTADCAAVNVNLQAYQDASVSVTIDGEVVESTEFNGQFEQSYEISDDADHEWAVDVVAHDDERWNYTQTGITEACVTPPPAEVVPPATPETVTGCAASLDDVVVPESTEAITYTKTDAGIVAALTSDKYAFPEDLGNFVPQEDGSVLLPVEYLVVEEPCEEPSVEPTVEPTVEPSDEASAAPVPAPSDSATPVAEEEPEELAATGATVGGAIAFAALLAAGGVALVWARRRMQNA